MNVLLENTVAKNSIKVVSSVLIVVAIALVTLKLNAVTHAGTVSSTLNSLVILAAVMLIAHSVEGIWAGAIAYRRGDNAVKTAIYTFFTGFVGLSETMKGKDV